MLLQLLLLAATAYLMLKIKALYHYLKVGGWVEDVNVVAGTWDVLLLSIAILQVKMLAVSQTSRALIILDSSFRVKGTNHARCLLKSSKREDMMLYSTPAYQRYRLSQFVLLCCMLWGPRLYKRPQTQLLYYAVHQS